MVIVLSAIGSTSKINNDAHEEHRSNVAALRLFVAHKFCWCLFGQFLPRLHTLCLSAHARAHSQQWKKTVVNGIFPIVCKHFLIGMHLLLHNFIQFDWTWKHAKLLDRGSKLHRSSCSWMEHHQYEVYLQKKHPRRHVKPNIDTFFLNEAISIIEFTLNGSIETEAFYTANVKQWHTRKPGNRLLKIGTIQFILANSIKWNQNARNSLTNTMKSQIVMSIKWN